MPRLDYKTCKACGKPSVEVGLLSWTRLCARCGHERLSDNIVGLATMSGEPLQRWRRGMAACVGVQLVDETPRRD